MMMLNDKKKKFFASNQFLGNRLVFGIAWHHAAFIDVLHDYHRTRMVQMIHTDNSLVHRWYKTVEGKSANGQRQAKIR